MARKKRVAGKSNGKIYAFFAALALAIAFVLSWMNDFAISMWVNSLSSNGLSEIMLVVVKISTLLMILAALWLVWINKKEGLIGRFKPIIAAAGALLVGLVIKVSVARPRPFTLGISVANYTLGLIKESYGRWDFSFPSSHTAAAFALCMFLPKKWMPFGIVLALIIAFSRVYFGLHYVSDVIAGAVIGSAMAYIVKNKSKF